MAGRRPSPLPAALDCRGIGRLLCRNEERRGISMVNYFIGFLSSPSAVELDQIRSVNYPLRLSSHAVRKGHRNNFSDQGRRVGGSDAHQG